jgi:hypothetical protein
MISVCLLRVARWINSFFLRVSCLKIFFVARVALTYRHYGISLAFASPTSSIVFYVGSAARNIIFRFALTR